MGIEDPHQFSKLEPHELEYAQRRCTDASLKQTLEFGIGIHHAGLPERDRKVVEELFCEAKIMVLESLTPPTEQHTRKKYRRDLEPRS